VPDVLIDGMDIEELERMRALPERMSEEDLEDFLTEAIGLYAEQTDTPLAQLRTFHEAKLLLANRGLVVGIGNAEFRISIVRSG
jgi:hypothetical protein